MVENQPAQRRGDGIQYSLSSQRVHSDASIGNYYEIKVAGYLDEHWAGWLGDLRISHDPQGNTLLAGVIPDQAALHGILVQIRDLGLPLVSLQLLDR